MSKLLALDQASRVTGYAVFDNNELLTFGKITASQDDIGDRLYYLRKQIIKLIDDYDIEEVVFEDIQYQANKINNIQTFKILAEVFGVLHELFTEIKIPQTHVLASVWKSTLNIKGADRTAQKKNAQAWVKNTYNLTPTQDECDAICIGAHYIKNNKIDSFDWSE